MSRLNQIAEKETPTFNLKGVGTVVLGVIKQGAGKAFDRLKILPSGKDILVKSIQMHDDHVTECKSPARVGLAIKGIDADDISRGDVLCSPWFTNTIEIVPENSLVFFSGQSYALLKPDNVGTRLIAKGIIQ